MALRRISNPVTFERESRERDERIANFELRTARRKAERQQKIDKLKAAYRGVMAMPGRRERANYQRALMNMLWNKYGVCPDD